MQAKEYIINIHEQDWSIILSDIYIEEKQYNILEVGSDSNINEFAHIRVDKKGLVLFVYDVIWVSNTDLKDKRFNEIVSLTHKNKTFDGTLNDALSYIKNELEPSKEDKNE